MGDRRVNRQRMHIEYDNSQFLVSNNYEDSSVDEVEYGLAWSTWSFLTITIALPN